MSTADPAPTHDTKDPLSAEADNIIERARSDSKTPIRKVETSDDLRYDPIAGHSSGLPSAEQGMSIVHSFVNRTVFFDYFRHVAHKRFPEIPPDARVQSLTEAEPSFYMRSIISDYVLKIVTSLGVLVLAGCVVYRALLR
jgi:hypothetical protein